MTPDETRERLRTLKRLEETLKEKRDFEGLVDVQVESMKLFDSMGNISDRLPQKAYCLARMGRTQEAKEALAELSRFSMMFSDQGELFRAVTLVSFFLETPATKLNSVQLNTIRSWLRNPETAKQVVQVVFDYSDLVEGATPFDKSRLSIKQTHFTEELLACVFFAMGRDSSTNIYYNRETNDVQQEVQGYLSSHMADDQSAENRRLAHRIMISDDTDPIIDGLHFLIPRLSLVEFLKKFTTLNAEHEELNDFVIEYKNSVMDEFGDYVESIDDLVFTEHVAKSFYEALQRWQDDTDFDVELLKELLTETRSEIALVFLNSVNKL